MPHYSNLLITGGSGFLGWNLAKAAAGKYEVSFTYHQHRMGIEGCQEYELNLHDPQKIEELVEDLQPEVIIHAAALTNVDVCENRRSMAHDVNVAATEALAREAEEIGARFIYISTDLVFDGKQGNYTETAQPKPLSYYGETKLSGEQTVSAISTNYVIVRMALMYGIGNGIHGCFTDWIRQGLQDGQPVALYTNQYRSPLWVGDGVRALLALMNLPVKNEIYHLAGSERINRYEFGQRFAQTFGYDAGGLRPIKMEQDQSGFALRGKDCSLNIAKIQHVLRFQLSDATHGLRQMKKSESAASRIK